MLRRFRGSVPGHALYFFYFDESGSRDPSVGTPERPKDYIYVLLAVGMHEREWRPFDSKISRLKLELAHFLQRDHGVRYELADCEVKSSWIRHAPTRDRHSAFLGSLHHDDVGRLVAAYYGQLERPGTVVLAAVIDKRELYSNTTHQALHGYAYEFLLERIEHYMREYHPRQQALVVMDDTDVKLNRSVTMLHATLQRRGNNNMYFPRVVEYPFFTRSELSNGVQLADLLAYNVYRAFRDEDIEYPYFRNSLPRFYRRKTSRALAGLKIWPDTSPLIALVGEANSLDLARKGG